MGITERFKQEEPNRHTSRHIMTPKPDKDTIKKKIISLMNIDTKILIQILENLILSYKKGIKDNDYLGFIWGIQEWFNTHKSINMTQCLGKNTGVGCHALLQGNLPDPGIKTVSPVVPALQAEPSQNPAWDLNPCGRDSNPAKTHGTWFQDLMKLGFLMSHHRKNSGKRWIYSDTERSTLQR